MNNLRERLERKIANNAQIYKPHGLVNSWRINYCTGANSLLPLVLELANALDICKEDFVSSDCDDSNAEIIKFVDEALQAIEKFVGDEK